MTPRAPSPRELEALRYLSYGLTVQMTADAMQISADTVSNMVRDARMKLRAKTLTHACCEAIRRKLI